MAWEPTMGKWCDEENNNIQEPLWRKLLKIASQHGDIKQLQQILIWFVNKNMHGDYYKTVLIGCYLKQAGVSLEGHIDAYSRSVIAEITTDAETVRNVQ